MHPSIAPQDTVRIESICSHHDLNNDVMHCELIHAKKNIEMY